MDSNIIGADYSEYVVETRYDEVKGSRQVVLLFPNSWGASILSGGRGNYSDRGSSFEVAELRFSPERPEGEIMGDVHGWMRADEVRQLLAELIRR